MTEREAHELLKRYHQNDCSEEERLLVDEWFNLYQEDSTVDRQVIRKIKSSIAEELGVKSRPAPKFKLWSIAAAAVIALISMSVLFFYSKSEVSTAKNLIVDLKPGGNRATLRLADGSLINLDTLREDRRIGNAEIHTVKYEEGELVYQKETDKIGADEGFNSVSTPKGGQYKITLPDGSKIWLNAASMANYPVRFRSRIREVTVSGEAYFEISKDPNRPFIVSVEGQKIEVLGTHFNVNSYDLHVVKTTLAEGSVKIASITLKPGEQAISSGKSVKVSKADLDLELAWKNGKTEFTDANIETVMQMLARWYDFEPVYIGKKTDALFSASISRSKNISEILNLLESTGDVHFKIIGRRVEIRDK